MAAPGEQSRVAITASISIREFRWTRTQGVATQMAVQESLGR